MELCWAIYAKAGEWAKAQDAAREHLNLDDTSPGPWLHLAYATRRIKSAGLPDAWRILLPAVDRFPDEPVIPFNLACYAAQMDRLDEAWSWLQEAVRRSGNAPKVVKMALDDADLAPIWERIRSELVADKSRRRLIRWRRRIAACKLRRTPNMFTSCTHSD